MSIPASVEARIAQVIDAEEHLKVWMRVNGDNHWQRLRDAMGTVLNELVLQRGQLADLRALLSQQEETIRYGRRRKS